MKFNKLYLVMALLSLLVLSPVIASSLVDADLVWPDGAAPSIYEGDVVSITGVLRNYGADYLDARIELRARDGSPLTQVQIGGTTYDLMMIPLLEEYNIIEDPINYPITFNTKNLEYAGYVFDLQPKEYSLKIEGSAYINDQFHSKDTDLKYFTVKEEDTTLTNLKIETQCTDKLMVEETLVCDVVVTDEDNHKIQNANVNMQYTTESCTTNNLGYCQINYVIPSYYDDGNYDAVLTASKTNYNSISKTEVFEIYSNVETPSLQLTNTWCETPVTFGEEATCTAQVIDEENNIVEDAEVKFSINSQDLGSTNYTDETYEINYVVESFLTGEGDYQVKISAQKEGHTGDEEYVTVTFVEAETLALEITSVTCETPVTFGEEANCVVTVVDQDNNLVQDADVTFTLEGNDLGTPVYTNGEYSLNYVVNELPLGEGDYAITTTANKENYIGDEEYVTVYFQDSIIDLRQINLWLDCEDNIYLNEELTCTATATETVEVGFLGFILWEWEAPIEGADVTFSTNNTLDNRILIGTTDTTGEFTLAKEMTEELGYLAGNSYKFKAVAVKENYQTGEASETFYIYDGDDVSANAVITYPEDPYLVNQLVKFDGFKSTASDGTFDSIEKCSWNNGESKDETLGCYITYNFTHPGNYTITLDIEDKNGYTDQDSVTVQVFQEIQLNPVAIILAQEEVMVGEKIDFDGSTSYAIDDNYLVDYEWSIEDYQGNELLNSWNGGSSLPFTFYEPGNYFVSLTVTDNEDLTDTTTHQISITEESYTENLGFDDLESGLKIMSFSIRGCDESQIEVGGDFELEAIIVNNADEDFEDVRMSFYLPEWGIQFKSSAKDIDEGEREMMTVVGYLPFDIQPGIYYPLIGLSDDHVRRVKVGYIEVLEG